VGLHVAPPKLETRTDKRLKILYVISGRGIINPN
jgi:hypothetical protein